MKTNILDYFLTFLISLFVFSSQTYAQELPIFDKGRPITINYKKCGSSQPSFGVKVDKKKWTINWKWDNKSQVWCGWGTESLPNNDLSEYLEGYLIIKFIGGYQGRPPEVKFIDFQDTHTNLINFDSFISGDPATGAVVKIPLKKFDMDPDFSANPKKIRTIQFDAEYNSIRGKIKISYIGLSKE